MRVLVAWRSMIATSWMLSRCVQAVVPEVIAHYMVGDVSDEHMRKDIDDAIRAGITGFSLNVADPSKGFVIGTLNSMLDYIASAGLGFSVHISMDITASGDASGGHPELFNNILQGYVAKPGYYQGADGRPYITTFGDGGLSHEQWDAWKLSSLANKMFFCPNLDATSGYAESSADWWWYWGNTVDCVLGWESAWQTRGGLTAGGQAIGSVEIDQAVVKGAHSNGKLYNMPLSTLQYKHAYGTNVYRPGGLNLPIRMEQILDHMSPKPDHVTVISWNDGPEAHYIGNIWPEQNSDPEPAKYVSADRKWSHAGWQPLIWSFSQAFRSGQTTTQMRTPNGEVAVGAMWHKTITQSTVCPNNDHPLGWELGDDKINWAMVLSPSVDASDYYLYFTENDGGGDIGTITNLKSGLNYGSLDWRPFQKGRVSMNLMKRSTQTTILSTGFGACISVSDCPDGIFNMNFVVVGLVDAGSTPELLPCS